MNLENLKNKTVLLFGKSRSFSKDEFEMQLKAHDISLVYKYSEDVDIIIDGAVMSPIETLQSEELYDQKVAEFINLEVLENILTRSIDEDVLMMSLKLTNDKQRLKEFLTNPQISDDLYLKLLAMYDWGDDDFYESDDNRDVSASLIRRYYKHIERNHNVEFSKLGLMHLALQCRDEKVLEVIAKLRPLRKSFDAEDKDHGFRIVTSIASNLFTPKSVLKFFIKEANTCVRTLIAMRKDIDEEIQNLLYDTKEKDVLEALSFCESLSDEIFEKLSSNEDYLENLSKYIKLNSNKYEFLKNRAPRQLAQNETLDLNMQKELMISSAESHVPLAKNKSISGELVAELLAKGENEIDLAIYSNSSMDKDILISAYKDKKNHLALAVNTNTPVDILNKLYDNANEEISSALAKNISTPIDILYQLQLDSKYERDVKENPSFSKHIQKENIGWQI